MTKQAELQEQTWELLVEVMAQGERHQLDSDILTPYHTQLLTIITTHQKQLLEELLSELPEKENIKNCLRPAIPEAFNECLDQVSALIEKKLKEQNQ